MQGHSEPPHKAFDGSLYCPHCGGRLVDPEPWHAHDRPPQCDTCEYTMWAEPDSV